MAKKPKIAEKLKEGVSVQEIENFARKYTSEVFAALAIIVASISSMFDFFTGPGWSIALAGLGAVISVIFPIQMGKWLGQFYHFINKQEKTTQIIIGIVRLIVAIFIPFVIFAGLGLLAGTSYHSYNKPGASSGRTSSRGPEASEEEHI